MNRNSKYAEISNLVQVIGCVYKNPRLFEQEDKYVFNEEDFYDEFHKIVFGSVYNLWQLGAKEMTLPAILDYLSQRPKAKAIFVTNKGEEFLLRSAEIANLNTFNYYYNRMKKMSLFRAYESLGMDLTWLYDPDNLFNTKKKQEQEDWLDNSSIVEIFNKINEKIDVIKENHINKIESCGNQIGDGIDDLLESFKTIPAYGYPLYGKLINTVTRGARLGKFYLASGSSGTGKTRNKIAQCCYIGCEEIYDLTKNEWIEAGIPQNCLYIATEQDLQECQTMCLSFISAVDEEHILKNEYYEGEIERIKKASEILKKSKIYFECLPDFTIQSIEAIIKKHIREHQVQYVFMDYIHSSASILTEVGGNKGIKGLREDNVLFLFASKLKDIAVQYRIFIMSSTQLNASYKDSDTPDQNLLRGSKAIADRIDLGMILMETTKEDREKLSQFCEQNGIPIPNIKLSVYKNRQGKWKNIFLWLNANRGICRFDPLFCTNWDYEVINMENLKIKIAEEQSAF